MNATYVDLGEYLDFEKNMWKLVMYSLSLAEEYISNGFDSNCNIFGTRKAVLSALGLRNPALITHSPVKSNIYFKVRQLQEKYDLSMSSDIIVI